MSFYSAPNAAIIVSSAPQNPDDYDDVVLAHEYGHFVLDKYSKDDSPAGTHGPYGIADPRLAWSEGWATYFGVVSQKRTSYADTIPGGMGLFHSIETLPTGMPLGNQNDQLTGNLSEGVVSAVLMDLDDTTNETNDTISDKVHRNLERGDDLSRQGQSQVRRPRRCGQGSRRFPRWLVLPGTGRQRRGRYRGHARNRQDAAEAELRLCDASVMQIVNAFASVAFMAAVVMAQPVHASMANPIEGRLTPETVTATAGTTVRFRLEMSTIAAFKQVAVRLKVPEGMALVSGVAQNQVVNFVPGETRVFDYELRVNTSGENKVWIEAEVLGLGASQVIRKLFLGTVNPVDRSKDPAPTIVRDKAGNTYQVQGISPKK